MTTTTKRKKPRPRTKATPKRKPVVKKFNHDISIFSGELGLNKDDLTIISSLFHYISSDEKLRMSMFESKMFHATTSNLYRIKYKLEALLHGKSA